MAISEVALAVALPVGIVLLLGALIAGAWEAGRRRRLRTDPLEAAAGQNAANLQRQLYGFPEPGSATTTIASSSAGTNTTGSSKSSRNPFARNSVISTNSFREEDLWDTQRDEVLDDREWLPLEAGWREQHQNQQRRLYQQQAHRHQSRSRQSSRSSLGRSSTVPNMPAVSSRMSASMSMALTGDSTVLPPAAHRSRSSGASSFVSVGHRGGPPPSMMVNNGSHGNRPNMHNVNGGASSSTLRSLGTVHEVRVAPASQGGRTLETEADAEATATAEAEARIEARAEEEAARRSESAMGMSNSTDSGSQRGRESPPVLLSTRGPQGANAAISTAKETDTPSAGFAEELEASIDLASKSASASTPASQPALSAVPPALTAQASKPASAPAQATVA